MKITRTAGKVTKKDVASILKEKGLSPSTATPEEIQAALAEEDLGERKGKAYYRRQANKAVQPKTAAVTPMEGVSVEGGKKESAVAEPPPVKEGAPGTLKWEKSEYSIPESGGSITVVVVRVGGTTGAVSCKYATKNQKAVAGKDFEETSGELEWPDGDASKKEISIKIFDDDEFEKDEEFTVVLSDATGGASFSMDTDGGAETDITTVNIENDDEKAAGLTQAMRLLALDSDSLGLAGENWSAAISETFDLSGVTGIGGKVMHVLNLPWMIMFKVICPPPRLCGGYPCFVASLLLIGIQVVLIADFATQMGCQMYIKNSVTAITFVALGTSLPDTFASMAAAVGDKYADNSIGNVTGSNAVNVFMGLGLPWLLGAIYWAAAGATPAWLARFDPITGSNPLPQNLFDQYKVSGAFVVRSGDLGLSVIVFTVCAILTIGLILLRRANGKQELGGNKPMAYASAAFLVVLWFIYLIFSIMAAYGYIG